MYNLIVTNDEEAWKGRRYAMPRSRFGEHTAESIRAQFQDLDQNTQERLTSMPVVFAYEQHHGLPARVGRINRFRESAGGEIRFEYEFAGEVPPISAEALKDLAWELDIGEWEMNRTHWAIKDVDLLEVLEEAKVVDSKSPDLWWGGPQVAPHPEQLVVNPTVFAVPSGEVDPRLVSVMMPFAAEFEKVHEAITAVCGGLNLKCERVDEVWEDSAIIQDIFALIYRSAVVVADLSGRNPNVLYEVGIAHTLGRPVVPISRPSKDRPFDLAHHRILEYHPNEQGIAEMTEKLRSRLKRLTTEK